MAKNVYYISGLGADERVFTFLTVKNANESYIKWLDPHKKESISNYSKRLIDQIDISKPIILIGVSFGGIVAQEIAKHVHVEKLIIISSVKSFKEYGIDLKLVSYTKIYKVIPSFILKWSNKLTADFYFGVKSKEQSKLLKNIIIDTDEKFMVWAIDIIMNWKNFEKTSAGIVHIQGDKDRIFTNRNLENVKWINGGRHFMIVNKSNEISDIINEVLSSTNG